ncbi:N-acetylglucosamine kinase [Tenacibaculum sp. ZS6-P6]|uniref:N-acetylglucosamine kinase n=1 Tax=Tenacibaculum sp. ZS6-P6 TaxID=3447503 RepID=UPI003F9D5CCC
MILIADSGSSKCDWIFYNPETNESIRSRTKGLNPSILSAQRISKLINENDILFSRNKEIEKIYFFGAGCGTNKNQKKIKKVLNSCFTNTKSIIVKEDLMAAAWATKNEPAIICILGTGSNCCYYDGNKIHTKIPSLGYIVMDEASGNFFGKEILKSYYYQKLPNELRLSFEQNFNLKPQKVINKIYNSKYPNKYLANFARFLIENKEHPYIIRILQDGVNAFIENQIEHYREELKTIPIHFIGSIAYHIQDIISDQLENKGLQAASFIRRPIEKLIEKLQQNKTLSQPEIFI